MYKNYNEVGNIVEIIALESHPLNLGLPTLNWPHFLIYDNVMSLKTAQEIKSKDTHFSNFSGRDHVNKSLVVENRPMYLAFAFRRFDTSRKFRMTYDLISH